jgi:hypothetical protein
LPKIIWQFFATSYITFKGPTHSWCIRKFETVSGDIFRIFNMLHVRARFRVCRQPVISIIGTTREPTPPTHTHTHTHPHTSTPTHIHPHTLDLQFHEAQQAPCGGFRTFFENSNLLRGNSSGEESTSLWLLRRDVTELSANHPAHPRPSDGRCNRRTPMQKHPSFQWICCSEFPRFPPPIWRDGSQLLHPTTIRDFLHINPPREIWKNQIHFSN